jgi:hypothetical protein
MRALALALALVPVLVTSEARAQNESPPQPATRPAADPRHWRDGDPVPAGYHVEDVPRSGLVKAGFIVTGIPYFFSVVAALTARTDNESGWLFVPFAGPWVTMGRRNYGCNPDANNPSTEQSLTCVADVFVVMGLIFDGVVQATGGALLLAGYVATKPGLVRNDDTLRVLPMRIGSGMGIGAAGDF